ncbi:MAG: response regulator [Candidatus Aminicenantes bacterium]|nr:response regulator [Candidatus Aminicenantes bacterium]
MEKKILLVDYDASSLESLSQLFRSHRFQVITATDGLSAFEKFKEEKPDAVILEAILPKIHGFDLTKRISEETHGRVPVVIVTGLYRGPQYRLEALSSFGAAEYFEKPVDKEKLIRSVQKLLSEEEEIEEDLPDSEGIIKSLAQRLGPAETKSGGK